MKVREVVSEARTDESPHLTVKQLAKRWHKSANAIYIMRCRGTAPACVPLSRKLLFPLDKVMEFEAASMSADLQSSEDGELSTRSRHDSFSSARRTRAGS